MVPGLSLAMATSSCRFFAGHLADTSRMLGAVAIGTMGVKSASGSNGSFLYSAGLMAWLV
ncbi:hypothetical protein D3C86_2246480 [compost metagenome]